MSRSIIRPALLGRAVAASGLSEPVPLLAVFSEWAPLASAFLAGLPVDSTVWAVRVLLFESTLVLASVEAWADWYGPVRPVL